SSPRWSRTRTTRSASGCSWAFAPARSTTACTRRRTSCRSRSTAGTSLPAIRRVAVVGAGFAGLAAADALARAGVEVTVLEARGRVGGRVRSRTLENGATVELGAEFVLPGHDVLRATVARLGLDLYEKGTLYGDREPCGGD